MPVEVDLIVPTIAGREASLERCIASFERHTDADLNAIIVRNSPSCGEGWIEGLERSKASYVALVADDLEVISDRWAQVCIEAVDLGFLPCPRVYRPDGGIESQGGNMNAIGHILARPTKDGTQVDFTTVPFLSREQIDAIGMIPTQYACDVWVSYRGRQLGWDTALVHGYDLVHYQEQVGRGAGMSQDRRDFIDTGEMFEQLAYGTHLPALRALLEDVKPKRVLEIGAGRSSTPAFLKVEGLEQLDSLESDPKWREAIRSEYPDSRLRLIEELPERLDYDLVFVDGPNDRKERIKMIRSVLSRPHPVVVIHDAEQDAYRRAIAVTNGDVEFIPTAPPTFVFGNSAWTVKDKKEIAVVAAS